METITVYLECVCVCVGGGGGMYPLSNVLNLNVEGLIYQSVTSVCPITSVCNSVL